MRKVLLGPCALGFLLMGMAVAQAQSLKHCFNVNAFSGWWRAAGDRTLYIRTDNSRYYRLDLTQSCGARPFPGAHLVLTVHGTDTICSPLDFTLRISQGVGDIPQSCFVKSMSEVPASEIAALKNMRP